MKAGQSGTNSALLVLVIGAFILLYILFLPPSDREALLDDGERPGTTAVERTAEANRQIVLEESPGLLLHTKQDRFEHTIPSFNLFTRTQDRTLREVASASVRSTRGEQKTKVIPLTLSAPTSNVRLTFDVADREGRLAVLLNEEEIFSGDIIGQVQPLFLENLEQENVIEFRTEPVSWQFWRSNFYDLQNIKITGTVQDLSNRESSAAFILGADEMAGLKEAHLIYFVDCTPAQVSMLSVYLNDRILSSRVPDCGSPVKTPIDPRDLVQGKNELRFFAEQGSYLVDQVFVKTQLKEPVFPVYFFDVNETQFMLLQNKTADFDATLTLHMVNDNERKAAELNINNFRLFLDTNDRQFNRTISSFIVEGSNFIRIEPETSFSIVNLEVSLE